MDNVKKLVVYYSLSGNSGFIAQTISKEINADLLEIKLKKDLPNLPIIKQLAGGMQVVKKMTPEILPFDTDLNKYDVLIFGTPVWASSFASPFKTLLSNINIKNKKIGLFCCFGGSEGKTFEKFKSELAGNEFIGEIGFKNPLKDRDNSINTAVKWAKELKFS